MDVAYIQGVHPAAPHPFPTMRLAFHYQRNWEYRKIHDPRNTTTLSVKNLSHRESPPRQHVFQAKDAAWKTPAY
jgi:hypothetical protein